MMVETSTREKFREELIFHYHNEFSAALGKLGFQGSIPSLLELNLDIMKKGQFGKESLRHCMVLNTQYPF